MVNKINNYFPLGNSFSCNISNKKPIYTRIPNNEPIELISYYDEFIHYYPNCELDTKQWFVDNIKRDWIILDCGANIGYFSILFARLALEGFVYAFEPTSTYEMLLKNIAHSNIKNIDARKIALGNQVGDREDNIYRIWGKEPERKKYIFTTIDEFVKENKIIKLDCIKIDVDSFDFEVLQGAINSLLKFNPFIMVELNYALNKRNQNNMQALQWLVNIGYKQAIVFDNDNFLFKRNLDLKNIQPVKQDITLYF